MLSVIKTKKELKERIKHLELENDYLKYHLLNIRDEADAQYEKHDYKIMGFARISRMACQCIPAVKNNNKEEQNNE